MTRYVIADMSIDPTDLDDDGGPAFLVRNSKGRVIRTQDRSKAQAWAAKRNIGIDEGEPAFQVWTLDWSTCAMHRA